jgi:sigma-B regulation protein RsbU (phosphoserine phosphatase)
MEINLVLSHIQQGLAEKRQQLSQWLNRTPAPQVQEQAGISGRQGVLEHLQVIETSLEKAEAKTLGICEVCNEYVNPRLLEMDYTACICLDHFSENERRQLEQELELSQAVQRALLPQQMPSVPGVELAAFSRPAQIVGGDYFDFFGFQDGAQGLVIADVAGHGVSASLLMTSLQTALRSLAPASRSPSQVIQRINHFYLHNANYPTFATLILGRYEPVEQILTYCNAGHNPPAHWHRREKRLEWLRPTGPAIGIVEDSRYSTAAVRLSAGDALLFYTDGVTEATNLQDELFGSDRLAALVEQNSHLPAQELVYAVRQALTNFSGGKQLADDITLLALKAEDQ